MAHPAVPARRLRSQRSSQATRFWRAHAWALLAVLPAFLYWIVELSRYHFFPDPLYGGDSWAQLGIATHIYNGNAPWEDPQLAGEWAFRDWLLFVVVAGLARVTGAEPLQVALVLPAFWVAAGGLVAYALGRRMFRSTPAAVLVALAWTLLSPFAAFQSSSFAAMLMVPLFLLALVHEDGTLRSQLLLGLAWAAASLSYLVAFFGTTLILAGTYAWRVREQGFARATRAALPVLLVALPVILLLWGPIFWIYHGEVLNPSHLYAADGAGWGFGKSIGFLLSTFLAPFDRPWLIPLALLSSFGIYAAWKQRKTHGGAWTLLLLGVGLFGTFSYVLTLPLLDTQLVYFRWPKIFLALAQVLLATHAIVFLAREWKSAVAVGIVGILVLGAIATPMSRAKEEDRAFAQLDDARGLAMLEAGRWVRENVPDDAVFLALDQEAHALQGITGVQVVAPRRTHANVFVDMDERLADLAVMIYGSDRAYASELMDRYGVTHAYVGPAFEAAQQALPISVEPSYADYWRAHGVPFEEGLAPRDPYGNAPLYPSILVTADAPVQFRGEFVPIHALADDEGEWLTVARRV